jgi:heme exporter protein A
MSTESSMIEVQALTKAYGLMPVLRGLDLQIPRGQFVALLGPNGSGKSTLLRLLAGLSRPNSGRILIGGWELPKEAAAVRGQIGMVAHKPLLYENLTARENLAFFGRLYNIPEDKLDGRIVDALQRVGLVKRADDLARAFSRGMQQRLSIARTLLHNPHVLLLDEPYTGLDQDACRTLDTLLKEAHTAGHTIVMTTHELERAAALADRAVILARGRLHYDMPTTHLDGLKLATDYATITT